MTHARRVVAFVSAMGMCWLAWAGPAAAQVRDWPSERAPKPLTPRPFAFPPYAVRTLANGLRVVVVQHAEQPVVSLQMLVQAGSAQDPASKAGVANLVSSLLDQGTATRSAHEIADAVDTAGAELTVLTGTDVSFGQVTVMADGVAFGLDLLSDVIRHPVFAAEELERQRQQLRSALKVSYEDPDYLASVVFDRLVFGFHPYGQPGDGTPDTIGRITRDDLVAFHRAYYTPGNAILAMVGDVAADAAFAAAERVFGSWEPAEPVVPVQTDLPPATRRVVVVDVPGSVQTEIRVGHLAIPRKHRDYIPLDLAVRILGGEGGNRLQQVLRTSRGLTYGASADLEAFRQTGILRAETDTRSPATAEALRVMIDEFFKIQREAVDERELGGARAYVAGSFPLGLETPGAISTRVLTALYHGVPLEEIERHRELVGAVTRDDISRVTREHLRPDRLSIVLVGDAGFFVPLLRSVGIRDPEVVPVKELDLSAPSLRRPSSTAAAMAPVAGGTMLSSRGEWEAAQQVVSLAVRAAGGEAALREVATVSALADTVLFTPRGPLKAQTKTLIQYPDRFRVDVKAEGGALVQAYDAGHAWLWDARGARDAPDAMAREFGQSVRRDWLALYVAVLDNKLSGRRATDETAAGGHPLSVVELWSPDLPVVRLAVDAATGRLARLSYRSPGPAGVEDVTEEFSDFRRVAGIWFPFVAVTRRENAPMLERTVTELKLNVPVEPDTFRKPR